MTTATITRNDIERELCRRDFVDFLEYVKVLEPHPGRGLIPFAKWPHLMALADDLKDNRLVIVLKARQLGFSWIIASYAVWLCLFREGSVVLLLSKDQDEAAKLLSKCKTVADNLPVWMQVKRDPDNTLEIGFPAAQSTIRAFAATKNAGRSATASLVVQDEGDFHEDLESNYAAYGPAIDAGGQLVIGSTSDKTKNDSFFKRLYRAAPGNGFFKRFIGWDARPDRDGTWRKGVEARYEGYQLEGEYPATEEEALAPSQAIAAFNLEQLKIMRADVKKPMRTVGPINIYQEYIPTRRYGMGSDTSHGVGGDYHVTAVMDLTTGAIVADIMDNLMPASHFADASATLGEMYGSPWWLPEDNEWGISVIEVALARKYKRLYNRDETGSTEKWGWHTDERSRWDLWGDFIDAVNAGIVKVFNEKGLGQFFSVIKNPDKRGKPEAMAGAHDDYPMAVALAYRARKCVAASIAPPSHQPLRRPASWNGRK